MSFRDTISSLVANAISSLAPITSGVVVSFDHKTYTATVRTTHRSGRGSAYYELPWPRTSLGVLAHAPQVETGSSPGTHAVIGFRGFDWNHPVLLAAYDPLHYLNTRLKDKRSLSSYTTTTDKNLLGMM